MPSRNRAANGDAVKRVRQGAEETDSPAADSTAAAGTAAERLATAAGRSDHGEAADAAQQQAPQVAADVAWGRADGNPAADARDLVLQRLLRPRSAAAHAMPIRPQLQVPPPSALAEAERPATDRCCDCKLQ